MIALATLLVLCGGLAVAIQTLVVMLLPMWWAVLALGLLMAPFLAQKSLYDHVEAVQRGLQEEGLEGWPPGRRQELSVAIPKPWTSMRWAALRLKALSENFSDGVIAPLFWAAIGGLAGDCAVQDHQHRRQHDRAQDREV
jgi:adenosylcobinamide-phosphate synthase